MPRHSDPQLAQRWKNRLQRFRRSGDSVANFCRDEGVSVASFYQWKRKLDLASSRDLEAAPQFVPIQLIDEAANKADHDPIEIQLPSGAVVRVPATLDTPKLCQLVSRLAGASQETPSC